MKLVVRQYKKYMTDIYKYPDESLALVSIKLLGENRKRVWLAYRSEPLNPKDSGWVFHSPNETNEFANDSKNFKLGLLKLFIEEDPSLAEIIDSPPDTCWERYSDNGKWMKIDDFFQ
jgi:hypothetical protein